MAEREKSHVTIMVGGGSRFMPLYEASQKPDSPFKITQVYTHKKESIAVDQLAPELGIRGKRWNFVKMHAETGVSRIDYEKQLAEDIIDGDPDTKLIFMTGWLLVFSKSFLDHFPYQDGLYRVLNVHPAYLPDFDENQDEIELPDGTKSPVFRGIGSQVIADTIASGVSHTGVSCYFVLPSEFDNEGKPTSFDVGHTFIRDWVKIDPNESEDALREKLDQKEDEIGVSAIRLFVQNQIEIESGKVKIKNP